MEVWEVVREIGLPALTGVIGYFSGKPRAKVEIEATSVDNAGKVIDKWEGYADRLERNIEQLRTIIEELNASLRLANDDKMACGKALMKLQSEYDELMQLYTEMQKELERVRYEKNSNGGSALLGD